MNSLQAGFSCACTCGGKSIQCIFNCKSTVHNVCVFQVLLSQVHRLRALDLLGRFLDLGPWAVSLVSPTFSVCSVSIVSDATQKF